MAHVREGFRMLALAPGDLIFSTTAEAVSAAIKRGTNSRFSHASIYFRDGVILEANDDGVGPRKVSPIGLDADKNFLGLPYSNWEGCVVMRLPEKAEQIPWERAISLSLRDHVGLDFPSFARMVSAAPTKVRLLARPFALLLDTWDWIRNREPMASDAWCSRLVGFVVSKKLEFSLSEAQRAALESPSPQRLFEISAELGFSAVDAFAPVASTTTENADLRALVERQSQTFEEWQHLAEARREKLRKEKFFLLLRATAKLVGALVVVAAIGLAAFAARLKTDQRPWSTAAPVTLEQLGDDAACAFRPIRNMGWTEGHKTFFCRVNGYGEGNFNQGDYSNSGACIRGPDADACRSFLSQGSSKGVSCRPGGVETVCRRTGQTPSSDPASTPK